MKTTHIGDVVECKGTEAKLEPGNGWTAWNISWDEYVKGSALPVPEEVKSLPGPAPSASGSPSVGSTPSARDNPTPPSNRGR